MTEHYMRTLSPSFLLKTPTMLKNDSFTFRISFQKEVSLRAVRLRKFG